MTISLFELFKIGVGPSSSHTVGPMVAARRFTVWLDERGLLGKAAHVEADLYGSLALTGKSRPKPASLRSRRIGTAPRMRAFFICSAASASAFNRRATCISR